MIMSQNKIALVTGGSRGIGRDIAISLAKMGAHVILTYHSNQEKALEVVKMIETHGQQAAALQLDVAKPDSYESFFTEKLVPTLDQQFETSTIDFLINNAGIGLHKPFAQTTMEEVTQQINIHLMAAFFMTQRALELMQDGGSVVNISTGLTRFSFPGYAAYAAAKAGVEVLSKYQAKELGERNIRVNVVAPGAIETDFGGGAVRDNEQLNQFIASTTALGRVGLPSDVGSVVAFLCSKDSYWINGQRIEVSGGVNL